jgi:hypothetical protein
VAQQKYSPSLPRTISPLDRCPKTKPFRFLMYLRRQESRVMSRPHNRKQPEPNIARVLRHGKASSAAELSDPK